MDPVTATQLRAGLYGVGIPFAATALALLPFAIGPGRRAPRRVAAAASGVGLALGYGLAQHGLGGLSGFPPASVLGWAPAIAAAGLLVGIALDLLARPAASLDDAAASGPDRAQPSPHAWPIALLGVALRFAVAAGAAYLLLRPLITRWPTEEAAAWVGGAGALVTALWVTLDAALPRLAPAAVAGPLVLASAGLAGVTALSGSALVGQLAGALAAGLGALAVAGLLSPQVALGRSAIGSAAALFGALGLYALHFADVALAPLALLFVAVGAGGAAIGMPRGSGRGAAFCAALGTAAVALVPVALAVGLVLHAQGAPSRTLPAGDAGVTTSGWGGADDASEPYLPYGEDADPYVAPGGSDSGGKAGW